MPTRGFHGSDFHEALCCWGRDSNENCVAFFFEACCAALSGVQGSKTVSGKGYITHIDSATTHTAFALSWKSLHEAIKNSRSVEAGHSPPTPWANTSVWTDAGSLPLAAASTNVEDRGSLQSRYFGIVCHIVMGKITSRSIRRYNFTNKRPQLVQGRRQSSISAAKRTSVFEECARHSLIVVSYILIIIVK